MENFRSHINCSIGGLHSVYRDQKLSRCKMHHSKLNGLLDLNYLDSNRILNTLSSHLNRVYYA